MRFGVSSNASQTFRSIPNLIFYVDASEFGGLASGTSVNYWHDLSGNGNHLGNNLGGDLPVYYTNIFGNMPGLYFDGYSAPSALRNDAVGSVFPVASPKFTIIFVCKVTSLDLNAQTPLCFRGSDSYSRYGFIMPRINVGGTIWDMIFCNDTGDNFPNEYDYGASSNILAYLDFYTFVHDGTNLYTYRGTTQRNQTGITFTGDFHADYFVVGSSISDTASLLEYWIGYIGLVLIYNRALSSTELNAVWRHLYEDWSLRTT